MYDQRAEQSPGHGGRHGQDAADASGGRRPRRADQRDLPDPLRPAQSALVHPEVPQAGPPAHQEDEGDHQRQLQERIQHRRRPGPLPPSRAAQAPLPAGHERRGQQRPAGRSAGSDRDQDGQFVHGGQRGALRDREDHHEHRRRERPARAGRQHPREVPAAQRQQHPLRGAVDAAQDGGDRPRRRLAPSLHHPRLPQRERPLHPPPRPRGRLRARQPPQRRGARPRAAQLPRRR